MKFGFEVELNNKIENKGRKLLILGQKYEGKYFVYMLKVSIKTEFEYYWQVFNESGFSNRDFKKINLEKFKREIKRSINNIGKWQFSEDMIDDELTMYFNKLKEEM